MVTTPISEPAAPPKWRWWLTLYPRLTTQAKRGLVVACLGAALLVQSFGALGSPPPANNPARPNALYHLASADPIGNQFQVNTYTTNHQGSPAVAIDADGDFVVTWHSEGSSGSDTEYYSIQAQRYNAAGVPQGNEFQVNSYISSSQVDPVVAMDDDGDFVIIWWGFDESSGDSDSSSIQGQRYNAAGVAQGSQFQVNSYTTNAQFDSAVALDGDGDFVVVWQSEGSSDDTSYSSIQGQRFGVAGATPTPTPSPTPTINPTTSPTPTPTIPPSKTFTYLPAVINN